MLFEKKEKAVISIDGMSCMHCVKRVDTALKSIKGVAKVDVSLEKKCAEIEFTPTKTNTEAFVNAVNALGFNASVTK